MPSVAVPVEDLPVQPSWTKWNPELLSQPKSTELLTPLSSKKKYQNYGRGKSKKVLFRKTRVN